MRYALLLAAAAAALAHAAAPPDARELVRQSIRNGERSWRDSKNYYCVKRDLDRQFESTGKVKSTDVDVYQVVPLGYGASYEEHVEHDHEPLRGAQKRKQEAELRRLQAETPAQKKRRLQKSEDERSYLKEVPDAFDFKIVGEENLPSGPAWVLDATPRRGYQARSRYARMFPNMRGKLWIDKKDIQWVKADALAMDTVSFGFFIARLAKGSHIVIEQQRLADGDWVPKRIQAKASARVLLFFNHNFEEDITYGGYRKGPALASSR